MQLIAGIEIPNMAILPSMFQLGGCQESLPLLNGEDGHEPINVVSKWGEKNKQTYKHHKIGDLWPRHKISNVRKEEECNRDDAGSYIGFSSQTNAIH